MADPIKIDPQTGERIISSPAVQIDPQTGERIHSQPALRPGVRFAGRSNAAGQPMIEPEETKGLGYWEALTNPVGAGGRKQGLLGGALQVGGQAIKTMAQPFTHPAETLRNVSDIAGLLMNPLAHADVAQRLIQAPVEQYKSDKAQGGNALAIENAAGNLLGGAEGGRLLGGGLASIPTKAHAGSLFSDIESQLADQPVSLTKTSPAIDRFEYYRTHGGLGSKAVADTQSQMVKPMNFPEVRMLYKNLGEETRPPGLLRRAFEEPTRPLLRRETSNVHGGMGEDLQSAAESGGRGTDYSDAMREYANAARVNHLLKGLGALGAGEAIRRTGLLGKVISAGAKTP